jgi:hypothetical protein
MPGQDRCHNLWCEGSRNWTSCAKGGFYLQPWRGYWRGPPYYDTCVSEAMLQDIKTVSRFDEVSFSKGQSAACPQGFLVTSSTSVLDGTIAQMACTLGDECDEPAHIFKCPNENACQPDGESGDMMHCAVGYHGPACAFCDDGYVWLVGHECVTCPPSSVHWATAGGVLFGAFALAVYYHFVARPLAGRGAVGVFTARIFSFLSGLVGSAFMARFERLQAKSAGLVEKGRELWEFVDDRYDIVQGGFRCLIGFMQVIGNLSGMSMKWPLDFSSMCKWFAFLKIDIEVPSVSCAAASVGTFTFYSRLLLYSLGPFGIILLTMLPKLCAKARRLGADVQEELHQNFVQAALFILFVLYPTVRSEHAS